MRKISRFILTFGLLLVLMAWITAATIPMLFLLRRSKPAQKQAVAAYEH